MAVIKTPFGKADEVLLSAPEAAVSTEIVNFGTFIKVDALANASELSFTFSEELELGAIVTISVAQGASAQNVTFGTGIQAPNLTGVANDVDILECVYDGTQLLAKSDWYKVVDAA